VRRRQFLFIVLALFILGALGELALSALENQYADGICTGLGLASLPPEARVLRLFHWVSRYDDRATESTRSVGPRGILTPRGIIEHPVYYREDCGAKVWLLGFLAQRVGLEARDLRLCDAQHRARHVVCEIRLDGRWAVFDPTVDLDFRRRDGSSATAEDLRDPALLAENAARAPAYRLSRWQFDHPERLHFEKIPFVGGSLRQFAARVTGRPAEELSFPPVLERAHLVAAGGFVLLASLILIAMGWSGRRVRRGAGSREALPLPGHGFALQTTDQD